MNIRIRIKYYDDTEVDQGKYDQTLEEVAFAITKVLVEEKDFKSMKIKVDKQD